MSELEYARALAEKVLNRPHADPDDELAILARQFQRSEERAESLKMRIDNATANLDGLADLLSDSEDLPIKQTNAIGVLNEILKDLA